MSAVDLVELLFQKGLITEKVRKKLHAQIKGSSKPISPNKIAKALIKKGLVDAAAVQAAVKEVEEGASETRDDLALVEDDEPQDAMELVEPEPEDEELGFAELIDEKKPSPPPTKAVEPVGEAPAAAPAVEVDEFDDQVAADSAVDDEDQVAVPSGGGKRRKRKKYTSNRWDSPLMLVGGGGLILMVALGGVLWFLMTRETAQEAYDNAEESYRQQAYVQAAAKYSDFLDKFEGDENASAAKVKLKLCYIWNDVSSGNWEAALTKVQEELPAIESEEAFDTARGELASILPRIMEGFAETALEAEDMATAQRNLDLAEETMEEVNKSSYLPTRFRKDLQPRIDAIDGIMKTVERNINRDKELVTAITQINAAVEEGETGKAYEIRRELLNKYPLLNDNNQLNATIESITEKEKARVQPLQDAMPVLTEEIPSNSDIRITLAARSGGTATAVADQHAYVLARGSVYAIDAADGSVAWRRFVGFGTDVPPVNVTDGAGSDVIAVDGHRSELVRLASTDGATVWRIPCDGHLNRPVRMGNQLLFPCSDDQIGRLVVLNSDTGEPSGGAQFPMPIATSPLLTTQGQIVQCGLHSSLFVLDAQSMECVDVAYLGHGAETIATPPVELLDHIIVAENPAPNFSQLHLFARNPEKDSQLREISNPIRLAGRVVVPMITEGKRLIVATDLGAVEVFELDPRDQAEPLKRAVTGVDATSGDSTSGYTYFQNGNLWVGNNQLTRYELQAARSTLARKSISNKGDHYVAPFQKIGNVLITARQPKGKRGVTVTAIAMDGRNEEVWETDLGVPPADNVLIHDNNLNVMTANVDLFQIGRNELKSPVINQPTQQVPSASLPVLTESLDMGDGMVVYLSRTSPSKVVVFDTSSTALQLVDLELGGDNPTALPISYRGHLVVPGASGAVYIFDPRTGRPVAHEFQPSLSAGSRVNWPRPVVVDDEIILPDGAGQIYRVALADQPQAHLAAVAQADTEFKPVGAMAAAGQTVYGIRSGFAGDEIIALTTTDLASSPNTWPLVGRVAWGPASVGDVVMISSDSGELVCLDSAQNELWRITLPHGALAGHPIAAGDQYLITSISGVVSRLDGKTGEELAKFDVGEPMGSGPTLYNGRTITLGSDGTLHVFRMQ